MRIVNVIAIFFKLGEWISVSFTHSYPMDALQKGCDGFENVLGQNSEMHRSSNGAVASGMMSAVVEEAIKRA